MLKKSIVMTVALVGLFVVGQINLVSAAPAELDAQWQKYVANPSSDQAQTLCKAVTTACPTDAECQKFWAEKMAFLADKIATADPKCLEAAMLLHSCMDKKWVGPLNRILSSAVGNHPMLFLTVLNKHQNQADLWNVVTYVEPKESKDPKARLAALKNRAGALETVGSGGEWDSVKGKTLDRLNKEINELSKSQQ